MPHLCPWWATYIFDNPLRRLFYRAEELFAPWVNPGMTALDLGCGRGYNTIGLARLVGRSGCVIAADVQPRLLEMVQRRARRAGLADRVRTHLCAEDRICLRASVSFVCAFYVIHELPDQAAAFADLRDLLRPDGHIFLAEPRRHVSPEAFESTLATAAAAGFVNRGPGPLRLSHNVLLAVER